MGLGLYLLFSAISLAYVDNLYCGYRNGCTSLF